MNSPADRSRPESVPPETPLADRVLVVIVNYRTSDLVVDCLQSLQGERQQLSALTVVVTDNASGDESLIRLRDCVNAMQAADWIEIRPLERNAGFAAGNNAGIRTALQSADAPRYVLLLNPDTWVRPGAVVELVRFLNQTPEAGIAGSRLEDPDGTPQRSAFRFPTVAGEFCAAVGMRVVERWLQHAIIAPPVPDSSTATDWVSGASMMIRRDVFDAIGELDEGYFLYYEELDFCRRANRAGWQCWYVPASRVVHLVSRATEAMPLHVRPKRRPSYWFESRRRYFLRNCGPLYTLGCDTAFLIGFGLLRLRVRLGLRPDREPPGMLADYFRHSVYCRGFSLPADAASDAHVAT